MKEQQKKLLSHILMVAAPLLVLLMVTVAWFINSRTINLSEMSLAAEDAGPGAALYPSETLGRRSYSKAALNYDHVTWGEKLTPEESAITIEHMLPGQCAYYLLVSDKEFTPRLQDIKIIDADGKAVTTAEENEALLLTRCMGLYLLDTHIDLTRDPRGQADPNVSIRLERGADGRLSNAVFAGTPDQIALPAIKKGEEKTAYILAIFCDGVYGQNGPEGRDIHVDSLTGAISFSLAFDVTGGE